MTDPEQPHVDVPADDETSSEVEQMDKVDAHPGVHAATEEDEGKVLRELYGEPGEDGIYRGAALAEQTSEGFEQLPEVDPSAYRPDSKPLDGAED